MRHDEAPQSARSQSCYAFLMVFRRNHSGRRDFAIAKSGTALPMTKHTSFSLGGHFTAFIEAEVSKGRYASASEVVRAGLRLLEEREAHLTRLRAALAEGEESGPSAPFDFDAFLADKRTGR